MPRKKKVANSPVTLSETLSDLKDKIPSLKSATEIPAQLSPSQPTLERLPKIEIPPEDRELIEPTPDLARPRPPHRRNGEERPSFTEREEARRPSFLPVPQNFRNVARYETAGIRVNKGVERHNAGTAALQFSEDRPLSRDNEYDFMRHIQDAGFSFKPESRQWVRPIREGEALGDGTILAVKIAKEIAEARNAGRGR